MKWFGVAVLLDREAEVPTPVGRRCGYCRERIEAGDQGVVIPDVGLRRVVGRPYHYECHMRMIVGSVAHLQGRCSCYGGDDADPPEMTLRQAARAAFEYWVATNGSSHGRPS